MDRNEMAWCPGCGNFSIRDALEGALAELAILPSQTVLTSGIGQAAKMPQYLEGNYFNGLHGRALPLAVGIKLARPELTVIAISGDGCNYGEGGNHFLHTLRKNLDITILTCNNKVYALTKGQSSPTTDQGQANMLDPQGNESASLNPLALAIVVGAPFVARGFAGEPEHLKGLLKEAILFKGTAVVDILQPCVSFNKVNTFAYYRKRVYQLDTPGTDRREALEFASIWGDRIPIGVLLKEPSRPVREPGRRLFRSGATTADMEGLLQALHRPI
ncbi:2-oxoglutarate ferredoxin oxidoreductase subunit beta [Syntrophus gentianae]|uniref:2-oxoglutarate ferredoxin oxidoreductase subunit beta n=1 Tax=Syntrophus gentianae TaxID=43775 RepID=A0A1H8B5N7_9BACT|nr:thiamine pyrophosphate-dependent enzyme [Syntrophus gentianae]SEM78300.1 2-oxoglutarate ferredoxin oxidoreductase subunit beta [Syntrophus gentianae]